MLDAIRQVLRGEIYLTARMSNRLMHNLVDKPSDRDPIKTLSIREVEVFEMIGQGLTTQQIAGKLKLMPRPSKPTAKRSRGN